MRIVVALGGNALLRRREKPDASTRIRNVEIIAHELARLAEKHELVLTHENGPQAGVFALQPANGGRLPEPCPFGTLGAQTQGMIGYWLLQAMQNTLPSHRVAVMVNQALMMAGDLAPSSPTKLVGEAYTKEEAEKLAEGRDWVAESDGEHYCRIVGSPMPQCAVETRLARTLLDADTTVVCSEGGGVSIVRSEEGKFRDTETVIDKDLTASVIVEASEANALLIPTNVDEAFRDFGTRNQKQVPRATPTELRSMGLPSGSMGPEVKVVCRFAELTGGMVATGRPENVVSIIEDHAGTIVTLRGNYGGLNDIRLPVPGQLDTHIHRA